MKITKVNYMEEEARFCIEEFPKQTFCIALEGKTTTKEVTDELKAMIPTKVDHTEEIYNNLNLKNLEGTDI